MYKRYLLILVLALCASSTLLFAQAIATAGPVGTSAHDNLQGNGGTTSEFDVEGPSLSGSSDCTDSSRPGDHSDFGEHITHVAETELPGNPTVFLFHSHITDDSDRCKNLDDIDRVRTEIKGGPQGSTDPELEHGYGTTSYYRWQFRLDENFVGTSRFTHLFQLKPVGGPDVTIPMVTLTARADDLEVIHIGDGTAAGDYRDGTSIKLAEPLIGNFRGQWVEAYVKVVHRNADDGGELTVRLTNVMTGSIIANVFEENIDMWRGATGSTDYINRPKWGIYRGLLTGVGQRDETVRFANFCSSENGDICPSLLSIMDLSDPTGLLPLDGAEHVPLSMPLLWDEVDGATSYQVFFGTTPAPPQVATMTSVGFEATLAYGQTYYYQIKASNGSETTESEIKSFSTLALADINDWDVARGHARPDLENEGDFEFNLSTPLPIDVSEASTIAEEVGNAQFTYFSAPSGNYRWRYRFSDGNDGSTVVLRLSKYENFNNLIWIEIKNQGFNQKISIKADNIKFDRNNVEVDFPADFLDDGEFHVVRITFDIVDGFVAPTLETTVYLDEETTPFYSIQNTTTSGSTFMDIGKSGGTNYGTNLDFFAVNETGAFAPETAGKDLPADLLPTALPLQWVSPLTVETVGKTHKLTWTVAEQLASDYFTVERSVDGTDFTDLGDIAAAGTLAAEQSYSYVDASANSNTRIYYRVRQTDFDGAFSYSNVVTVEPISTISLLPSPTEDWLNISGLPQGLIHYSLLDLNGRQISQGKLNGGSRELDCRQLKSGVYVLQLWEEKDLLTVQRFVKR